MILCSYARTICLTFGVDFNFGLRPTVLKLTLLFRFSGINIPIVIFKLSINVSTVFINVIFFQVFQLQWCQR